MNRNSQSKITNQKRGCCLQFVLLWRDRHDGCTYRLDCDRKHASDFNLVSVSICLSLSKLPGSQPSNSVQICSKIIPNVTQHYFTHAMSFSHGQSESETVISTVSYVAKTQETKIEFHILLTKCCRLTLNYIQCRGVNVWVGVRLLRGFHCISYITVRISLEAFCFYPGSLLWVWECFVFRQSIGRAGCISVHQSEISATCKHLGPNCNQPLLKLCLKWPAFSSSCCQICVASLVIS